MSFSQTLLAGEPIGLENVAPAKLSVVNLGDIPSGKYRVLSDNIKQLFTDVLQTRIKIKMLRCVALLKRAKIP
jgi:hypothetical protein